ncbi:hypothetical protein PI124_g7951 [Phytophthora idaei]|nr:hypothetical protein PI125_g7660 [Phytophthora idaei]KAG3156927.1 hypothetical protein PI126_g8543 [Phytophthora idaei]KAG3247328.1 hypothetical protein PI124_g7951 [Phytophthora idaei]
MPYWCLSGILSRRGHSDISKAIHSTKRREKPAPALPARTPPVTPQWIPSTGVLPPHQPPFVLQKVRSEFDPLSSDEPLATDGWQEAVSLHLHPPEKAKREVLGSHCYVEAAASLSPCRRGDHCKRPAAFVSCF